MNKRWAFLFVLVLSSGIAIFSCKKRPFDRRNRYTGNWIFTYHTEDNTLGQSPKIDSGNFTGRIYYNGKTDSKGRFWMEFAPGKNEEFEVKKNGDIYRCDVKFGAFQGTKSFTLASKRVHICNYWLGGSVSYTVAGKR